MYNDYYDDLEGEYDTEVHIARFSFSLESDNADDYERAVKILAESEKDVFFLQKLNQDIENDTEEFKFRFAENNGKKEIIVDMEYFHEYEYHVVCDRNHEDVRYICDYGDASEESPFCAAEFIAKLLDKNGIKVKTDESGDIEPTILYEKHYFDMYAYKHREETQEKENMAAKKQKGFEK